MHPLQLALDVQDAIGEKDWLVIDGGNTHFWSEIAINIAGSKGKKIGGILHPGTFSMLGVGVPFALSAKNINPNSNVILISGDGAFLSGGLSIEAAFQENKPIVVVIDNNPLRNVHFVFYVHFEAINRFVIARFLSKGIC